MTSSACRACGAEQPAGARFCSVCGTALVQMCPSCGTESAHDAAFCAACGTPLQEGIGRGAMLEEHEERRVVTVLFADLAGSTALGSRIDPEELRTIQGELFELVNAEVERFGGISEKFVGDAVLAVFGVPLAHDDDAERAVRAALRVRDGFPAFATGVRDRHGVDVGLRIGVNTGEVVAGREAAARGELMVSGDTVNVAARLQQRAEPGHVLVGERTQTATRRAIRYADVGAAPAKGKDVPIPAWEATTVVAQPGARGIEGLSAEMIGREEELTVLRALTTRVGRERAPQLVTIYGHAGVGKSRLVSEFVAQLPEAHLLQGKCLPYGEGITYWPLGEAAKGHAGILDTDPAEAALRKLESAVREHVQPEHVTAVVDALGWTIGLRLPEDDAREIGGLLRDSWRRYLGGLGHERLTVLVVEDVHWASEPLLELLEKLTDSLADTAVLTICTARPEFFDTRPWGGGVRDTATIRLSPLLEAESTALVESLVGTGGLPRDLTGRIVARAEGNPFYVEEILQMLIDREVIARENGGWSVREDGDEVDLPDSIRGVIAARVDLLDAASRESLRRCSVMGRVFWPHAVGVDEAVIAALGRRALVTEHAESTVAGMREFAFKHALTHDVAYATLPRAERRDLHRQVGMWVEDVAPGREGEMAEIAAYHYDRALEYGETSPEVRSRCFALLVRAGEGALARAAGESARSLFRRAVELADGPREHALSLIGLGRAEQMVAAGADRDLAAFTAARDEAAASGDPRVLAESLSWLSRTAWLAGRYEEALPAATAALEALSGLDESPQLARATARLSQLEMLSGLPQAEQRARDALELARRVGDTHAEVNARVNILAAVGNRGVRPDLDEAHEIVRRALEAGNAPEAYRCVVNTLWSAQAFFPREELEDVMGGLRQELEGVPPVEGLDEYFDISYALFVDVPAGRWDAIDDVRTTVRRATGLTMIRNELAGGMALRRGELEAARTPLDELRALALRSDEPQRLVPMAGVVAPFAALTGDREALREISETVLAVIGREWAQLPSALPRALALTGDTELLERVAAAFTLKASQVGSPRLEVSAAVAEGLLSRASGRAEEAVAALERAVEHERSLGWAYRAACLDVELAVALDAAGREADADEVRERATAVLERLGCVHAY